ncbi:MAG TPA: glycosyltransferase [Rhizomicrobium sp.]|nr:glycosyltransferase [Rhizomicrobium sp.]
MPRKILFISSNFPPVIGGSAVVYHQLCKNAGGRIIALSASRDYRSGEAWNSLDEIDAGAGYPIHRIPFLRPPTSEPEPSNWIGRLVQAVGCDLPIMFRVLLRAISLIISHRIKVVCLGELIYGGWLVFPLRYLLGRKVLIYTHGEEVSQTTSNFLARLRGSYLRHAHGVIAVSLFCKGQVISKYQIDQSKIHVVSNGVDLESFNCDGQNRAIWPESIRDRPIILSVSRLVERKGQESLIRAMPEILRKQPDAYCAIVGDGPLEGSLRSLIGELGLQDHCAVLGAASQSRILEYFKNCDVFALPCRTLADGDTEGFGLVFLEAGACGKPVVAGVAGGTVEAVVDGETGFLVDGTNPSEVADAVSRILADPVLAKRLGDAGWRRAQNCGWHNVTARFLAVCDARGSQFGRQSYAPENKVSFPPGEAGNKATKLLVTVDVEEEFEWKEFRHDNYSVKGVEGLRQFHLDCRSVGISPVYLLTYPILRNEEYRGLLKKLVSQGEAEVGIHLHSWSVPPHWEQPNAFTSYQCNLPEHIEYRKLQILCQTFEECFGMPVSIHRAGRWGGSDRTSSLLDALGIRLDLSPSTGYCDAEAGGPDFTKLDGLPFWSGSNRRVLTVPASSVNYMRGPRWISSRTFDAARYWPSWYSKARKRGKPVRFSPENADEATLFAMAREFRLSNLPVAVYTLHNTSLYIGGNPYSESAESVAALRSRSVNFFARVMKDGFLEPTTCAQLLAEAVKGH